MLKKDETSKNTKPSNHDEINQAEIISSIKEKLAEILKDEKIELATVAFTIKGEKEPQIYRKGHFYDTTKILQQVMVAYRTKIAMDLGL